MKSCTDNEINIQISQVSAATNLRLGGMFYSMFSRSLYVNATAKELIKSIHICQTYHNDNKSGTFFMDLRVYSSTVITFADA